MQTPGVLSGQWFTRATLIGSALTTAALAVALWRWNPDFAKGIGVGGGAGIAGFWMMARRARSLPTIPKAEVPYRVYRWTFARMLIYAIALFWSHLLDPEGNRALLGAAAGLFIVRVVMIATGIAAWRKGLRPPREGRDSQTG